MKIYYLSLATVNSELYFEPPVFDLHVAYLSRGDKGVDSSSIPCLSLSDLFQPFTRSPK